MFKYELLEMFLERFDVDEELIKVGFVLLVLTLLNHSVKKDQLDRELKSCCNRLLVTPDSVLTAAYYMKRFFYRNIHCSTVSLTPKHLNRTRHIQRKNGPYTSKYDLIPTITQIENEIGPLPARYHYTHFSVFGENMALLEPYGWVSIINLPTLTLVTKFQAFQRAEFTMWLRSVI